MSVLTMEPKPALTVPPVECCERVCLERPRYFSGQLLTDAELTAEQRYVIERLRLHNRDLHGWGVVCGLEVVCDPKCHGQVLVRPGHAIDCCGNDIVLCEAEPFKVIGYLKERARQVEPDCGPGAKTEPDPCAGAKREYCLVLSFTEEKARPVTALMRDNGCKVSRCEPSRIKERYRFDLIESIHLPPKRLTLLERVCKCIEAVATDKVLMNVWDQLQDEAGRDEPKHDEFHKQFCAFRDYVQDLYTKNPHNVWCNVCTELKAIKFPSQGESEYYPKLWTAFAILFGYVAQYLLDCICHELLVRCPECEPDDRVVVACLTVKGDAITHICNLARRWHPSPLQRHDQEIQIAMRFIKVIEGGLLKENREDAPKESEMVKAWRPIKKIRTTPEEQLEWLCCKADLTKLFVEPKPKEGLEGFRERLNKTAQKVQDTYKQIQKICESAE